MRRKVAFIAHPYGGDQAKRENAARWLCWLAEKCEIVPVASRIIWTEYWTEDRRELGIELNKRSIDRCDCVILCGGSISPGMAAERDYAVSMGIEVIDMTSHGYEAP